MIMAFNASITPWTVINGSAVTIVSELATFSFYYSAARTNSERRICFLKLVEILGRMNVWVERSKPRI
jgi:hypothetical protein